MWIKTFKGDLYDTSSFESVTRKVSIDFDFEDFARIATEGAAKVKEEEETKYHIEITRKDAGNKSIAKGLSMQSAQCIQEAIANGIRDNEHFLDLAVLLPDHVEPVGRYDDI